MNFAIACGIVHPTLNMADVDSIIDNLGMDDDGFEIPDAEDDLHGVDDDLDFLGEEPQGPADHINDLYA